MTSLLSTSSVTAGLGQFITQLVPGVLADQQIQDLVSQTVSSAVSGFLGDDLGAVVGPQIGAA
ncbi:MAG: hypothetical protein WAO90_12530, partial [Mycobacterium sp.]